jgi:hypothetical protein
MIPLGVALALAFTACGGSTGRSTVPPPKQAQNQVRHVRSIPCTPDSYGYCFVLVSRTHSGSGSCVWGETVWEIYGTPDVDYGPYAFSWSQCGDATMDWNPDDPAVEFGDPNLP